MNDLFDKNAHRLGDEEREDLWRRVSGALPTPSAGNPDRDRERGAWRRLRWTPALAGAAVTLAGVVALLIYVRMPQSPREAVDAAARRQAAEQQVAHERLPAVDDRTPTDALVMQKASGTVGAASNVSGQSPDQAVAPASPDGKPAVASPAPAGREPAAQMQERVDVEPQNLAVEPVDVASAPDKGAGRAETPSAAGEGPASGAVTMAASATRVGAVHGRVIDTASGQPLPYATIVLVAADGDSVDRVVAVSINDGTFTALGLEPGRRYTLEARYLGFDPQRVDVDLRREAPVDLAFELQPVIVATLETHDVAGARYSVDVKGAKQEQRITSDRLTKYALDSVEETTRKQTGARAGAGETYVRGGRSGEPTMGLDGSVVAPDNLAPPSPSSAAPAPAERQSLPTTRMRDVRPTPPDGRHLPPPGPPEPPEPPMPRPVRPLPWRPGCVWVPPHWSHPNGEPFDAMYFQNYGVNPFIVTEEDNQSTFALDVDNASYTITRRYLSEGHLPPRDAVRVEEFINALPQGYPPVRQDDFRIQVDGAASPFGEGYHLIRIGLQAREVSDSRRPTAHLVFVIDVSGSMGRENRLEAVKRALLMLLDELRGDDTVGIVTFETVGRVVLEPTSIEERWHIEQAIESLRPMGSTNLDEGLTLGYRMARSVREEGSISRIILCSDGVANQARTSAEEILEHARRGRDDGIHLSSVGFGMGNYNDVLMEKLADQGDGNYHYVDSYGEAARVFRENLTGLLQTVAEDAKVQVEFDPDAVLRYRLLGYENRDVADEDFRNDRVDAGEVGAGHQVTALYEVKLAPRTGRSLGVVRLRYRVPEHAARDAGKVRETEKRIALSDISASLGQADPHLRLTAIAAELAEILRGSYWAKGSSLADLGAAAERLDRDLTREPGVAGFLQMVRQAERVDRGRPRILDDDDWPDD